LRGVAGDPEDLLLVAHVAACDEGPGGAERLALAGDVAQRPLATGDEHERGALAGEAARSRVTDPARRSGDDDDAVASVRHVCPLSLRHPGGEPTGGQRATGKPRTRPRR